MEIISAILISLAINGLLFAVAYKLQTDKLTDFSYSFSFVVVSLYAFSTSSRQFGMMVILTLVLIWAARLGAYLVMRIRRIGRDKRFDGRRENFRQFASFWLGQAISVPIILLPVLLFFSKNITSITYISVAGLAVWLLGLVIESLADYQKFQFAVLPENRGRWIDSGLWSYSRHPNYLGEILVWAGVYIFAASNLTAAESLLALISPIFITILLRYVSGVPLLEKAADKKWGNSDSYQKYRLQTGLILPKILH